jgi:hypothetical protein
MPLLHSPAAFTEPRVSPDELALAVRRSNHDTALAGWAVTTMAVALLIQVAILAAAPPSLTGIALAVLALPVLAAITKIVLLLDHASASLGSAADRVQLLAGFETRRFWTFRARLWTYGTALAFAAWTVAVQTAVH